MKIHVNQDELLAGLLTVQRAISSKSTLPILSGIYMSAANGVLSLRATDLEIGINLTMPVEIVEEGATVLPARYLVEIVKRLPVIPLTVETEEASCLVKIIYGTSQVELNSFSAAEYPLLPEVEGLHTFQVNADLFSNALRHVLIAVSGDTARPIFTGVLLEIEKGQIIKLVGTDTHRLAYRQIKMANAGEKDLNHAVIIPSRTLNELTRIFRPEDNLLEVRIAQNQILFQADSIMLVSRLIEGQFPNYELVIPKEHTSRIRILKKAFHDSVERASLLAKDDVKTRSNVIKLTVAGNNLIINSKSAEIGNLHEEIPVYLEGEDAEIAFNARYLSDVLRVIDEEEIVFDLTGPLSAGIIKPLNNDNALFLVLPIRMS